MVGLGAADEVPSVYAGLLKVTAEGQHSRRGCQGGEVSRNIIAGVGVAEGSHIDVVGHTAVQTGESIGIGGDQHRIGRGVGTGCKVNSVILDYPLRSRTKLNPGYLCCLNSDIVDNEL